jgi:hypothetical protein
LSLSVPLALPTDRTVAGFGVDMDIEPVYSRSPEHVYPFLRCAIASQATKGSDGNNATRQIVLFKEGEEPSKKNKANRATLLRESK